MQPRRHISSQRAIAGTLIAGLLSAAALVAGAHLATADDAPIALEPEVILASGTSGAPQWGNDMMLVTEDYYLVTTASGSTEVIDVSTGAVVREDTECEPWSTDKAFLTDTTLTCLDFDGNVRRVDLATGNAVVIDAGFEFYEAPAFVSATATGWLQVGVSGNNLVLQEVEISGSTASAPTTVSIIAPLGEDDWVSSLRASARNDAEAVGALVSYVHNYAEGGSEWKSAGIISASGSTTPEVWTYSVSDWRNFVAFGHGTLVVGDNSGNLRADTVEGDPQEWTPTEDVSSEDYVSTYPVVVTTDGVMWLHEVRDNEWDLVSGPEWKIGNANGTYSTVTDHWILDASPANAPYYAMPTTVTSWGGEDYVVSLAGVRAVVDDEISATALFEFPPAPLKVYGVTAENGTVYWSDDSASDFGTNDVWSRSLTGDPEPTLVLERATGRALAVANGVVTTHVVTNYPLFEHAVVRVDGGVETVVVDGPYNGQQVSKQHYTAVTGACTYPNPPVSMVCDDDWNVAFVPHDGGAIVETAGGGVYQDVNNNWHVVVDSYGSEVTANSRTSSDVVSVSFAPEPGYLRSIYLFDDVVYITYEEEDSETHHTVAVDLLTEQVETLAVPADSRIDQVLDVDADHIALAVRTTVGEDVTQWLSIRTTDGYDEVATAVVAEPNASYWLHPTRAALAGDHVVWTRVGVDGEELVAAQFANIPEPSVTPSPSVTPEPTVTPTPTPTPTPEPIEFDDVPESHPFAEEIAWLVEQGVTTGYEDGTFRPSAGVSRMAMAAFLYRFAGEPDVVDGPSFTDVAVTHPFYTEITWLASTGVTTGYSDGTFRPGAGVSRMAMAAFLYRYAGEPGFTAPAVASFSDVPTSHPFYEEIEWLASTGVSTGYGDGTFRPNAGVSRMAMAAFLMRFSELDL